MSLIASTASGLSNINTTGATLSVAVVTSYVSPASAFNDTLGNSYSLATSASYTDSGTLVYVSLFYCISPITGTSVFGSTSGGAGVNWAMQVHSGGPYSISNISGNTTSSPVSSFGVGTLTIAANNAVVICGLASSPYAASSVSYGFAASARSGSAQAFYAYKPTAPTTIFPSASFPSGGSSAAAVLVEFDPTSTPLSEAAVSSMTVDVGMAVSVSGGTGSQNAVAAATIGVGMAVTVGTPVAEVATAAVTIGVGLAVSVGGTTVNTAAQSSLTVDVDMVVSLGALPFSGTCPLAVAFPGVPYSQPILAFSGVPPYAYKIVSQGFSPSQLNVVCLGDSMTVGYPVNPAGSYPTQLASIIGTSNITNLGIDGETSSGVLSTEVPEAVSLYNAAKQNVACVWCGINDIGPGGSIATLKSNYTAIVSALKTAGFFVIAFTLPPSNYMSAPYIPGYQVNVPPFNAWILAGSSGANAVCNSGQDIRLSNPANTTYFYTDELHLVTDGYGVVAQDVGGIILGGLPPGFSLSSGGVISGTGTVTGNYPYTVQISDSFGDVVQFACQISISSPAGASRPLNMLTSKQWAAISEKGATGILQTDAYVDQAWPNAGIHVWPIPSQANPIKLTTWMQVASFGSPGDSFQLPPAYYEALKYALAVQASQSYKRQVNPAIAKLAASKKDAIQLINAQILQGSFSPGQTLEDANLGTPNPLEPKKP